MSAQAQAVLIGGAFTGVLWGLPFVSLCCCLWLPAGGAIAVYLLQQRQTTPLEFSDAALTGGLAGAVGAVVQFAVSWPIYLLTRPLLMRLKQHLLSQGSLPPEFERIIEQLAAGPDTMVGLALGMLVNLVVGSAFAALGGLLGALAFRRAAARPGSDATAG